MDKVITCFKAKVRTATVDVKWIYYDQVNIPKDYSMAESYPRQFDEMISSWEALIPEGTVAIDIGTGNGDTTLPMAHLVGRTGKVYGFEPNFTYADLQENLALNPSLNIEAYNLAIMKEGGSFNFLYDPAQTNGGPAHYNRYVGNYPNLKRFNGINLEEFLIASSESRRISFIKIDTEGYDCEIIKSIVGLINQNRPAIQVERFPAMEQDTIDVANNLNYRICNPFTLLPTDIFRDVRTQDVILLPN